MEHAKERPQIRFLSGEMRGTKLLAEFFWQPCHRWQERERRLSVYHMVDPDIMSRLLEYVQAHGAKMTALKGCNLPGTSMVGRNGRFPAAATDRPVHVISSGRRQDVDRRKGCRR